MDKFRENNMSGACAGALKNFINYLVDKKDFSIEIRYIKFEKSKSTKKMPKSIEPLEIQKLIDAMESLKDKNLTLVLYSLGLRVSEGLKLKWLDFNWVSWLQDKTKQGEVRLENTKGGKFRAIPVSSYLMNKLYNEHQNKTEQGIPYGGLLFDYGIINYADKTKSLEENQYNYIVTHAEDRYRKLLYKVSKEILGKRINPHMLRHSLAMDMMNHNVPIETIKEFLGHSQISSTEIYAHASAEKLKRDLEKYNEKENNPESQIQA
jgi:integrase